jgi:hypothetical protein
MELRGNFIVINVAEVPNVEGFFQRNSQKHIVEIAAFGAKDVKVVLRHIRLASTCSSAAECAKCPTEAVCNEVSGGEPALCFLILFDNLTTRAPNEHQSETCIEIFASPQEQGL